MRGATGQSLEVQAVAHISIHAPHAGRDENFPIYFRHGIYFNPRAPCGARLAVDHAAALEAVISIHAPHAGRDQ